jgi:phosphoinositide-3-kinase regulatory subunit 4
MSEHKKAVNQLAVSPDSRFFVSGSDDGTVKVWDCRRLERDVCVGSQRTWSSQSGCITAVAICERTHSVASASDDGSVRVFRVETGGTVASKSASSHGADKVSAKLTTVQSGCFETDGGVLALTHFTSGTASILAYTTLHGCVNGWDLRTNRESWSFRQPMQWGVPLSLAVDPDRNFIVAGTSRGHFVCWDLRFQIMVKEWSLGRQAPIRRLHCPYTPSAAQNGSSWLLAAVGGSEVSAWEIESGRCVEVMSTADTDAPIPACVPTANGTEEIAGAAPFASHERGSSRCMLVGPDSGWLLTGGTDKKIRFWDLKGRPSDSYVVSGLRPTEPAPVYSDERRDGVLWFAERPADNQPFRRDVPSMKGPAQPLPCHQDAIMDLAIAPSQQILISASRDGVIKAWK